jgi:hypothetical protein
MEGTGIYQDQFPTIVTAVEREGKHRRCAAKSCRRRGSPLGTSCWAKGLLVCRVDVRAQRAPTQSRSTEARSPSDGRTRRREGLRRRYTLLRPPSNLLAVALEQRRRGKSTERNEEKGPTGLGPAVCSQPPWAAATVPFGSCGEEMRTGKNEMN